MKVAAQRDTLSPSVAGTPGSPVRRSRPSAQTTGSTAEELLSLQRTSGNQAVVSLLEGGSHGPTLQRWPWSKSSKKKGSGKDTPTGSDQTTAPRETVRVVKIGKEQVRVSSSDEEKEARQIVARLGDDFGVTLSSPMSIAAIKHQYNEVDEATLQSLQTNVWEMKELRGVLAAVTHFAPIMGKSRKKSSLAKRAQGVTSLGRVKQQVDANYKDAPLIDGVMGEYMGGKKNVTLFDTQTDLVDNRYRNPTTGLADNETTITANAVHEMAHGLIEPLYKAGWVEAMDFWLDNATPSGEVGAEEPPTTYGATNAGEDMAESVAIFFTNRENLKTLAPKREAYIAGIVAGWTPKKKAEVVHKSTKAKGGGK